MNKGKGMEQRLTLITLRVADLKKSDAFYIDGLGWKAAQASNEEIILKNSFLTKKFKVNTLNVLF